MYILNIVRNTLISAALITAASAEELVTKVRKAQIVNIEACPDYTFRVGDVSVLLTNGKTELWSSKGNCIEPQVSPLGNCVGWVHFTNYVAGIHPSLLGETLQLHFTDGSSKEFKPGSIDQPFIEKWGFADNGSSVIIKSRGHHGPAYLIKYKITNGDILGNVDNPEYKGHEGDLPDWAKPYTELWN